MTLKVAILVKQVPDHEAVVHIDGDGALDIENRYVSSFYDEIAVEQGLAIKKALPEAQLLALSFGKKRAVEALRRAVAMGIDDVERLADDSQEEPDGFFVASVLAARLRTYEPDIILCGKQAGDDELGAVGPMIGEFLGVPHVSAITSLDIDVQARTATVTQKRKGGTCTLQSGFPMLAATEKGLIEPHLPVVTRVMKAMKAKIPSIPISELAMGGVSETGRIKKLGYSYPATRPDVQMISSAEELVNCLIERGALG